MRRLLLVFLIALLPLRGLVGDAMAVAMTNLPAHEGTQTAALNAMPCPDHAAAALPAHEGAHGASTHSASHGDQATAQDAEHQHTACDLCNGPAMADAMPLEIQPVVEHSLHVAPVERFASSLPHQGIKPPIS
ncbi:MAG TPA: hypothetical protein VFY22_08240 [Hydrogenophaga sp.]|nr:hypothetical protein [Hydrogenophaga sp.]